MHLDYMSPLSDGMKRSGSSSALAGQSRKQSRATTQSGGKLAPHYAKLLVPENGELLAQAYTALLTHKSAEVRAAAETGLSDSSKKPTWKVDAKGMEAILKKNWSFRCKGLSVTCENGSIFGSLEEEHDFEGDCEGSPEGSPERALRIKKNRNNNASTNDLGNSYDALARGLANFQ